MLLLLLDNSLSAQRPRFNDPSVLPAGVPIQTVQYQQPGGYAPNVVQPMPGQPFVGQPMIGQPIVIPGPVYDPFALQVNPGFAQSVQSPGGFVQSGQAPGGFNQPPPMILDPNQQMLYNNNPYIPIAPQGATIDPYTHGGQWQAPGAYFPGVYGAQMNSPSGAWPNSSEHWPSQAWARLRSTGITRLFERPRFRYTFIGPGDEASDMGIHDVELATTVSIPNFLWGDQPLRVSPGFVFHFWDGPSFPGPFFDMPPRAYSTYIAFDYSTSWQRQVGAEANLTVGLYTDFKEVTSDSVRLTGVGLGWVRLTPNTTLKFGIEYLDRLDIKLLPAGGLFIQPTPDIKLNLYFPRPKIAMRLPNFSNFEVWGYAGGEYGGGSWTVERAGGFGDQVDINDKRVFLGVEWLGPRGVTGFFEGGYVFERELVFRVFPGFALDLSDSYMLRAGIAF